MKETVVKIVVFTPETHADAVREALADADAGVIGYYNHCTFSIKGIGRFMPMKTARPVIGAVGKLEEVAEERIETVCDEKDLDAIIAAVKKVHPYEKVAIDVYPLLHHPHEITGKK